MAFSITSRFNILATTQISLVLTTNPSRREHMTPPFPEFLLGPQCIPEAAEFKLCAKARSTNSVNTQTWPCQLSFLPTPSWCLDGFQFKCPHLSWISLLINEGTTTWCIYFLLTPLPWSCGATCPQKVPWMQILVYCWTLLLLALIIEGWEKTNPLVRYVSLEMMLSMSQQVGIHDFAHPLGPEDHLSNYLRVFKQREWVTGSKSVQCIAGETTLANPELKIPE